MNYKIREMRKKRNMSRRELSNLSTVPYSTLQDWELGKRKPTNVYQLQKIAKTLDCYIEDLIESEE